MKKIKYFLFVLTVVALLPLGVFAKEKVNVYLFKREGCGFCANALTFFNNLSNDEEYKNYFNLVTKEVSNSKINSELLESVGDYFGVNVQGVPFIVIGEEHFEGYSNTFDDQIKEAIKKAYENEIKDVVASLLGNEKESNSATTIVILLAIIAGVAFLVYMAKEKNDPVVEEKIEKEEIVEEKVVSNPKTVSTTKKKNITASKKSASSKKTTTKKQSTTNKK